MRSSVVLVGLLAVSACKRSAAPAGAGSGSGSGSGSGPSIVVVIDAAPVPDAAPPVATFTAEAKPTELPCGDAPVPVPPVPAAATSTPPPPKPLAKAAAIAGCRDRTSAEDLCTCLVAQVDQWGPGHDVAKPVECSVRDHDAGGGVLEVRSTSEEVPGGSALVFGAVHGATWSAVSVIASAEPVDREEQPKASNDLRVTELVAHPLGASTMYWIAVRDETQDKTAGEVDRAGVALGTVCIAGATDGCFDPVVLAAWNYSYPAFDEKGACNVASVETYKATLSATQLRVELTGGKADAGASAVYALDLAAAAAPPMPTTPATPTTPTTPTTPPAPPDAAVAGAAGADDDDDEDEVPFGRSEECVTIVKKIQACRKDPAFAKALDEGVDAATAKRNQKLRKQIEEWPLPGPTCDTYFGFTFQYVGFLTGPDVLIEDHVLDSCTTLGTAIRNAGGLPGGEAAM